MSFFGGPIHNIAPGVVLLVLGSYSGEESILTEEHSTCITLDQYEEENHLFSRYSGRRACPENPPKMGISVVGLRMNFYNLLNLLIFTF